MSRSTSPAGLDLIKRFEGFFAEPKELAGDVWVVGHGHVRVGAPGAPVSREAAEALLLVDLGAFERAVALNAYQELSQSQFDALVSFAFSVGLEAFEASAVLRRVNAGDFVSAACAMDAWRHVEVDGQARVSPALVRRRAAEKAFFLADIDAVATPSAALRPKLDYAAAVLTNAIAQEDSFPPGALVRPRAEAAATV